MQTLLAEILGKLRQHKQNEAIFCPAYSNSPSQLLVIQKIATPQRKMRKGRKISERNSHKTNIYKYYEEKLKNVT